MLFASVIKFVFLLAAFDFVAGESWKCPSGNIVYKSENSPKISYQTEDSAASADSSHVNTLKPNSCESKLRFKRQDGGLVQFGFLDIMVKPTVDTEYMANFLADIKQRYKMWKTKKQLVTLTPLPKE